MAEHYTSSAIGSQTWEIALDAFPVGAIQLPGGAVNTVTSVTYLDPDGDSQVMDDTLYSLDNYGNPAWLVQKVGTEWPETQVDAANAVKVRYVVGEMAESVRTALFLIVAHLYEQRGDDGAGMPRAAYVMLDTVKVYA
jgi:uncharacterized phiE125 gp8 family phage protein